MRLSTGGSVLLLLLVIALAIYLVSVTMARRRLVGASGETDALHQQALEQARRHVEEFGWHMPLVSSERGEIGFLYTIGLWHTYRHPEILLFAPEADPAAMAGRLQNLVERIQQGEKLVPGPSYDGLFGKFSGSLRPVHSRWYPHFLGLAESFYGDDGFPVLQLYWPDGDGRFPWQPGFSPGAALQPLLDQENSVLANLGSSASEVLEELEESGALASDLGKLMTDGTSVAAEAEEWQWLTGTDPRPFWLTPFGDLFLATPDGRFHWLDTGTGEFEAIADDETGLRFAVAKRPYEFLKLPTLLELRALGLPARGEVYSWRIHPAMGGEPSVDNFDQTDAQVHVSNSARALEGLRHVPSGTEIGGVDFEPLPPRE